MVSALPSSLAFKLHTANADSSFAGTVPSGMMRYGWCPMRIRNKHAPGTINLHAHPRQICILFKIIHKQILNLSLAIVDADSAHVRRSGAATSSSTSSRLLDRFRRRGTGAVSTRSAVASCPPNTQQTLGIMNRPHKRQFPDAGTPKPKPKPTPEPGEFEL